MKKWIAIIVPLLSVPLWGDSLQWQLPGDIGTIQLPATIQATDAVAGYDFVLHKGIAGMSTSVLSLWKEIDGDVGAVGEYPTNAPNVQPYLALGVDIKKHLPSLIAQVTDLKIGAFGRYDTTVGRLGAGVSASYAF